MSRRLPKHINRGAPSILDAIPQTQRPAAPRNGASRQNVPSGTRCRLTTSVGQQQMQNTEVEISYPSSQPPNARHHPRPYSTIMREFVMGRRVHAVVRQRVSRSLSPFENVSFTNIFKFKVSQLSSYTGNHCSNITINDYH